MVERFLVYATAGANLEQDMWRATCHEHMLVSQELIELEFKKII